MKVYLAGPEVFLPNGDRIIDKKREICRTFGLLPVVPTDISLRQSAASLTERARLISQGNEAAMNESDLLIANLTPFRGVSADAGTIYEVGFMRGLGRPLFGYSSDTRPYVERVRSEYAPLRAGPRGVLTDAQEQTVEDMELEENLMISSGIEQSGGFFVIEEDAPGETMPGLTAFVTCLRRLADQGISSV